MDTLPGRVLILVYLNSKYALGFKLEEFAILLIFSDSWEGWDDFWEPSEIPVLAFHIFGRV